MFNKFLIITLTFCLSGFTNPVLELCQETQEFYSREDDIQPALDESVAYVLNLREQIEALGYEVPTIQELIYRLDEDSQVNGLSRQMQIAFSPEESLGDLSGHFYCCSQSKDDEYWRM